MNVRSSRTRNRGEEYDLNRIRRPRPRTMSGLQHPLRRADEIARMAKEMVCDIEGCVVGSDVDKLPERAEMMSLLAQALARELIEIAGH